MMILDALGDRFLRLDGAVCVRRMDVSCCVCRD